MKMQNLFKINDKPVIVLQDLAKNEFVKSSEILKEFDFESFSGKKTLFDYQQNALKNALLVLNEFFNNCTANKEKFYYENYSSRINSAKFEYKKTE